MTTSLRSYRIQYISLALLTIAVGLLVHLYGSGIGPNTRDILGDALWAGMIVWLISTIAPQASLVARAAFAYALCVAVELSQLYHPPVLDALRASTAGHLVLGSGFDPRDLAAYAFGVGCAALLDATVIRRWN